MCLLKLNGCDAWFVKCVLLYLVKRFSCSAFMSILLYPKKNLVTRVMLRFESDR